MDNLTKPNNTCSFWQSNRFDLLTAFLFVSILASVLLPDRGIAQAPTEQIRVTVTDANVRSGPGIEHNIIISISQGTILPVLGKEGVWFRVQLTTELGTGAEIGFIHESLAEVLEGISEDRPISPQITRQNSEDETDVISVGSRTIETGPLGAGIQVWGTGGFMPGIHYDLNDRITIEGNIGLYENITSVGGQAIYRFGNPQEISSTVTYEFFAGAGASVFWLTLGEASDTLYNIQGSAGTFVHLVNNPRFRFKGTLSYMDFNISDADVRGIRLSFGALYFF